MSADPLDKHSESVWWSFKFLHMYRQWNINTFSSSPQRAEVLHRAPSVNKRCLLSTGDCSREQLDYGNSCQSALELISLACLVLSFSFFLKSYSQIDRLWVMNFYALVFAAVKYESSSGALTGEVGLAASFARPKCSMSAKETTRFWMNSFSVVDTEPERQSQTTRDKDFPSRFSFPVCSIFPTVK